jgi:hypothetical protein
MITNQKQEAVFRSYLLHSSLWQLLGFSVPFTGISKHQQPVQNWWSENHFAKPKTSMF